MSKFKKFAGNSTGIRNRLFTETVAIALIFTMLGICFNSSFTEKLFINRTKKEMCSIAEKIKTYDLLSTSYYKDISELESLTNAYIEIYSYGCLYDGVFCSDTADHGLCRFNSSYRLIVLYRNIVRQNKGLYRDPHELSYCRIYCPCGNFICRKL